MVTITVISFFPDRIFFSQKPYRACVVVMPRLERSIMGI